MQLFFFASDAKKSRVFNPAPYSLFFCMSEAEISLSVMECFKILLGNGADLV